MTRSVAAAGGTARRRALESGISDRELARRMGVSQTVVRSLFYRNSLVASVTIAELRRLLADLGMTWSDLLDDAPSDLGLGNSSAVTNSRADAFTLGALLVGEDRGHKQDRIARALGWTRPRLAAACEVLDDLLKDTGLRLFRGGTGLSLRAHDTRAETARSRLAVLVDDDEGLKGSMARILYRAWLGALSKHSADIDHTVQIAALIRRGAIEATDDGSRRYNLTSDVRFALDF